MRILGRQFVMGRTIAEALARAAPAERDGYRHSYDMLGEAARTAADADRYLASYRQAIAAIGAAADPSRALAARANLSVKLSALHPRYEIAQQDRVRRELGPRLHDLCVAARDAGIGLTIDAEESERLDLSLDLIEQTSGSAALADWEGLGLARAGLSEARPAAAALGRGSRRAPSPPAVRAPGQGRLLGHRDQARPGARPGRLRGVHPQGLDRSVLSGLRAGHAGRAAYLSGVRDPQRFDLERGRRARRRSSRLRVPAAARHGRGAVRADRRPARPPMPRLRTGRQPRGSARLSGAPAARERRQHLVRQPGRRSRRADRTAAARPGGDGRGLAAQAASANPAAHATCTAPRDATRSGSICPIRRSPTRCSRVSRRNGAGPGRPRRWSAATHRAMPRGRCSIRATIAASSAL